MIPFVGIHPEIFAKPENSNLDHSQLDGMISDLAELMKSAKGIGEVGLDLRYGQIDNQEYLLRGILSSAESINLPITFHCRETSSRILDILASYKLRQNILFHWFSGSESELRRLHDRGIYTSFGPSILFSKRMSDLVSSSEKRLILTETDSPTPFRSLFDGPGTPLLISSVALKMGLILKMMFREVCELVETNMNKYLLTQD
jgi:TatD DNase family protein